MTRCLPQVVFGHIYHPNVIEGALAGGVKTNRHEKFDPSRLVNTMKNGGWSMACVDPGGYTKSAGFLPPGGEQCQVRYSGRVLGIDGW